MEQENERLLKKIRGLEQQLQELEKAHGDRVQELLRERRRERDRENTRCDRFESCLNLSLSLSVNVAQQAKGGPEAPGGFASSPGKDLQGEDLCSGAAGGLAQGAAGKGAQEETGLHLE